MNQEEEKNQYGEGMDFSKFPLSAKTEKIKETEVKRFSFQRATRYFSQRFFRMSRKEKTYISIIVISLITTIIILVLAFGGQETQKTSQGTPVEDCPPEVCPPESMPLPQ